MRTAAFLPIGITLGIIAGCSILKQGAPAPTKSRIVLHRIVDFDKSEIRPDSIPLIEAAAAELKTHPNLGVVVEGHSDSTGTLEYNQKLSLARAETVRDSLVQFGVDSRRIVVIGKGSSEPAATNATPEGRAQNRRVTIVVYQPE